MVTILILGIAACVMYYYVWPKLKGDKRKRKLSFGFGGRSLGSPAPSKDEQLENRLLNIQQAFEQMKREHEKLAHKISDLENAARQRFDESGSQMLCPSCENNKVYPGDYLCADCRHG